MDFFAYLFKLNVVSWSVYGKGQDKRNCIFNLSLTVFHSI